MSRLLCKAEYAPTIALPYAGEEPIIHINHIIPTDLDFKASDALDMQLRLNKEVQPDTLQAHITCNGEQGSFDSLESPSKLDIFRDHIEAKAHIDMVRFRALGAVSLNYQHTNTHKSIGLAWHMEHHDLIPLVANTIYETHRYVLHADASQLVHLLWQYLTYHKRYY